VTSVVFLRVSMDLLRIFETLLVLFSYTLGRDLMSKDFVVWVGDSPTLSTGQARVTREFCKRFKQDGHVPTIVGFHHNECSVIDGDYGIVYSAPKDQSIPEALTWLMQKNPLGVIFSHDCWVFPYIPYLRSKFPSVPLVGYFTIDGEPVPISWVSICDSCDVVVSPSQYGAWGLQQAGVTSPIRVVPYGVDHDVFYRSTLDRPSFSLSDVEIPSDAFVVLFVGMNTSRKRIDSLIRAFSNLPNPNSYLVLITKSEGYYPQAITGVKGCYDLPSLISTSGCSHRIVLMDNTEIGDSSLAMIYNLTNVLVLTSEGEGFGLPLLEAMACGTVPITTDYTVGSELVGDCGYLVKPSHYDMGSWNLLRAVVDSDSLSQTLLECSLSTSSSSWRDRQRRCTNSAAQFSWDRSYREMLQALRDARDNIFEYGRDVVVL